MFVFKPLTEWLEYHRERRATQREFSSERKAREVTRGDALYEASNMASAKTEGGAGFSASEPSSRH